MRRHARALHNRFSRMELPRAGTMSPRPRFVTQIHKFRGDTMRKIIFGGLLASTMLVPAFAQNNPPASTPPSAQPPAVQPSTPPAKSSATVAPKAHGDMWRASKLIGL